MNGRHYAGEKDEETKDTRSQNSRAQDNEERTDSKKSKNRPYMVDTGNGRQAKGNRHNMPGKWTWQNGRHMMPGKRKKRAELATDVTSRDKEEDEEGVTLW